ncbi:unnamed protein product [Discosporangium mesarthrocarpum]
MKAHLHKHGVKMSRAGVYWLWSIFSFILVLGKFCAPILNLKYRGFLRKCSGFCEVCQDTDTYGCFVLRSIDLQGSASVSMCSCFVPTCSGSIWLNLKSTCNSALDHKPTTENVGHGNFSRKRR